jgi:DNA-binding transcriptional ArsR family regulator
MGGALQRDTRYVLYRICYLWHIRRMLTTFEVLAQPIRRSILDHLRDGEHLVGVLADAIGLTQPLTSKHLRVLRDAGFVTARVDGPRRWYSLRVEPLVELDDWLTPYRWMWETHLDRLGAHLDTMPDHVTSEVEGDTNVR